MKKAMGIMGAITLLLVVADMLFGIILLNVAPKLLDTYVGIKNTDKTVGRSWADLYYNQLATMTPAQVARAQAMKKQDSAFGRENWICGNVENYSTKTHPGTF